MVFGAPSLGAFLPPIIKAQKLDEQNGLSITFVERTPDAYTAQFNSGEFQLGGSAALLTVGQADVRGVKVAYLFNLFDFWGAVVTVAARGQDLAQGSRGQGSRGRARHHQLPDVRLVRAPAGRRPGEALGGEHRDAGSRRLRAGGSRRPRSSCGSRPTPSCSPRSPTLRTLDLQIAEKWTAFAGSRNIPYLGVAAHIGWIEKNRDAVPKLYATYKAGGGLDRARTRTRPRN